MSAGHHSIPLSGDAPEGQELPNNGSRRGSWRSAKRARQQTFECCVCLEQNLTEKDLTYPFECTHHLCDDCNRSLQSRGDLRCPQCRTFRCGYSEADMQRDDSGGAAATAASPGLVLLADILQRRQVPGGQFDSVSPFIVLNLQATPMPTSDRPDSPSAGGELQRHLDGLADGLTEAFNQADSIGPEMFRRLASSLAERMRGIRRNA